MTTIPSFRYASVLEFRHAREVARAPRVLDLDARAVQFLLDVLLALQVGLLGPPDLLEIAVLTLKSLDLPLEGRKTLA